MSCEHVVERHGVERHGVACEQRQKGIVEKLYAECMALEELLEEAVNTLGPDARDILGQIRCALMASAGLNVSPSGQCDAGP